jgi:two-component system response regulator QseB
LTQAGPAVDLVASAEDADAALRTLPYGLIVLDINLPGKSGMDFVRELREKQQNVPVLALTARDTTRQKIEGLNAGMDDYLVKPFDLDELLARVQALFRRSKGRSTPQIKIGDLTLDSMSKTVWKADKAVTLSAREFAILAILLGNAGNILNKQEIEDKLYGWDIEIESNAVEVHISHLRKKLGEQTIKTIRGMGYIVEKVA